eukprot:2657963-Rhodomonas_salina.1
MNEEAVSLVACTRARTCARTCARLAPAPARRLLPLLAQGAGGGGECVCARIAAPAPQWQAPPPTRRTPPSTLLTLPSASSRTHTGSAWRLRRLPSEREGGAA